ncbi:MAG: hypothetical protein IPP33_15415, partial [Flavobacteriales bacterium]|nr:hypothetical protein [Flavobacteriales bacterium]
MYNNSRAFTVVGNTQALTYSPGCTAPTTGLAQCNAGSPFTFPAFPDGNQNNENCYLQQWRVTYKNLLWSSFIGQGQVFDVSAGPNETIYTVGSGGLPGEVPLLSNPAYFSDVEPFSPEGGSVLGFNNTGLIWGTKYGTADEPVIAASRTLDRIYVGGMKSLNGFVPQNC